MDWLRCASFDPNKAVANVPPPPLPPEQPPPAPPAEHARRRDGGTASRRRKHDSSGSESRGDEARRRKKHKRDRDHHHRKEDKRKRSKEHRGDKKEKRAKKRHRQRDSVSPLRMGTGGDAEKLKMLERDRGMLTHDPRQALPAAWLEAGAASIARDGFSFDTRGDRDNLAFGCIYHAHLPRYRVLRPARDNGQHHRYFDRTATLRGEPTAGGGDVGPLRAADLQLVSDTCAVAALARPAARSRATVRLYG